MDTQEPIVTIKLTTDNSKSIDSLVQLLIVTLIILNIKLVISIMSNFIKMIKKPNDGNTFYVREPTQYVSLHDPNQID